MPLGDELPIGPPPGDDAAIVFVHGAIVNGWEMAPLRRRFARHGYRVRQFYYRSMVLGLAENVARLRDFIAATEGGTIHVIGHSMGGVLLRHAFETRPDPRPGRLIALGSPFLDCWVGHRCQLLSPRYGPNLMGRTVHDHITGPRDPVWRGARELGIIAGTFPLGVGSVLGRLPRPSDGVVLLEETRLQGVKDHVHYRLNHFALLFSTRCFAQMARFLATGHFAPA
jgi:pimeloyl-ACP methyl ester carboxylesterase